MLQAKREGTYGITYFFTAVLASSSMSKFRNCLELMLLHLLPMLVMHKYAERKQKDVF